VLSLALALSLQGPPQGLQELLGIPYVADGVLDERGRWTTFSDPGQALPGPGLNCSGFLVAAARRLLGFTGTPSEAGRDRLGDSGPGAVRGQDWDFGWDLVLNLSEGRPRRWLFPEGPQEAPGSGAEALRGFSFQDSKAWSKVAAQIQPGRVCLADFTRRRGGQWVHHHVALLLKEPGGRLVLYQTLPEGQVHRLVLSSEAGLARLRRMFGPGERLLLLEVEPS